ncbi:MAG: hypothetical protein KJ907_03400, partial [Actinobacteria bacterium]|nr:hypothetical protein [Actinomycetota bacterium]
LECGPVVSSRSFWHIHMLLSVSSLGAVYHLSTCPVFPGQLCGRGVTGNITYIRDGSIRVIDVDDGKIGKDEVVVENAPDACTLNWSHDGRRLAYAEMEGDWVDGYRIMIFNVDTSAAELIYRTGTPVSDPNVVYDAYWSAADDFLYVVRGAGSAASVCTYRVNPDGSDMRFICGGMLLAVDPRTGNMLVQHHWYYDYPESGSYEAVCLHSPDGEILRNFGKRAGRGDDEAPFVPVAFSPNGEMVIGVKPSGDWVLLGRDFQLIREIDLSDFGLVCWEGESFYIAGWTADSDYLILMRSKTCGEGVDTHSSYFYSLRTSFSDKAVKMCDGISDFSWWSPGAPACLGIP